MDVLLEYNQHFLSGMLIFKKYWNAENLTFWTTRVMYILQMQDFKLGFEQSIGHCLKK